MKYDIYSLIFEKETSSTTNKLVMEMIKSIKLLIISMNHQRNNINGINILIQMSMYYEIEWVGFKSSTFDIFDEINLQFDTLEKLTY
ncbi:hypothetical protein H8356DRAFT_1322136 [Neocallimastix lanati (nom. inval.)]|nr:hypothetical protein H8356DRAFT_1322136 [Neocallimastix sp. JGI-2020a]